MPEADAVAERVFDAVADLAPRLREGLWGRRGEELSEENPTGDTMIGADVWADSLLSERIAELEGVGTYASEDLDTPHDVGSGLSVSVDPLDGSSNVASNNLCGTIVGVYDEAFPAPGTALVGAAYVVYGPITTMVVARGDTVTEYAVRESGRNVIEDDVTLPADPTVYGFGGRVPEWSDAFRAFVRELEGELKLRYGGAMVGDVNQVIAHGGIFGYPGLADRPRGKLRLQFESAPMAYVVEAAGGASSDGAQSLLSVEPETVHERVPTFLGTPELIERLEAALA